MGEAGRRCDGEDRCVLVPTPTSFQTWCTGPSTDYHYIRAQQNSELHHGSPEET